MKKILTVKTTMITLSTLLMINACGGSSVKTNTYEGGLTNESIVENTNTTEEYTQDKSSTTDDNQVADTGSITNSTPTKNYIPNTKFKPTTNYSSNTNKQNNTTVSENASTKEIGTLKVSNRMLKLNNKGFFWMADTAWTLPARLSKPEIVQYLDNRKAKGFNVIQISASFGDKPFLDYAYTQPNTPLWNKIDFIIDEAAKRNIFIALLPSWNERLSTTAQATTYGTWVAKRYLNKQNIIWVIGGDSDGNAYKSLWSALGTAINNVDNNHLISYHPTGNGSSTDSFKDAPWIDFHMLQTGHNKTTTLAQANNFFKEKYNSVANKPILDAEPRYETISKSFWESNSINNGRFTDTDVRKIAYMHIFSGAFGHTYGHQSVWQMFTYDKSPEAGAVTKTWKEALNDPGANQMGHIAKLMRSRPIVNRTPDQSIIKDGYAFATKGNGYAFVYLPNGGSVTVKLNTLSANTVKAYWYNPKSGKTIEIDTYSSNQAQTFNAPTNQDMILILDDTSKGYKAP
ncbi:MAG: glycoside hydrolase family 140 protein [Sulfurovum sp.]|nr:glycoside hydrolase family 140 protein [Sulfurovum sp.]